MSFIIWYVLGLVKINLNSKNSLEIQNEQIIQGNFLIKNRIQFSNIGNNFYSSPWVKWGRVKF